MVRDIRTDLRIMLEIREALYDFLMGFLWIPNGFVTVGSSIESV